MGTKLLWTGLTIMLALDVLLPQAPQVKLVGAIFMAIGCVLLWLDK